MPPDSVDMVKDGRVSITSSTGGRWTLRRPLFGEYRELRARLQEAQDAKLTANSVAAKDRPEPLPDDADDEAKVAYGLALRRINRATQESAEDLNAAWVEVVFNGDGDALRGLSDKPLPEDRDAWPLYLIEDDFIVGLVDHWRDVPLARGGGSG